MWRKLCLNPSLDGLTEDNLRSLRMVCSESFKSNYFKSNQIERLIYHAVLSIRKHIKIHSTNSSSTSTTKLLKERILCETHIFVHDFIAIGSVVFA